jgi:hypothetical protein
MTHPTHPLRAAVAALLAATALAAAPAAAQLQHDRHHDIGLPCTACHQDGLFEVTPPQSTCVSCHGTMLEIAPGAVPVFPDPHRSPHLAPDEVPECLSCHKIHGPSEDTCTICHRGFEFNMK